MAKGTNAHFGPNTLVVEIFVVEKNEFIVEKNEIKVENWLTHFDTINELVNFMLIYFTWNDPIN